VSLLPATATVIGVVVLAQIPTAAEIAGVALVVAGVALHREAPGPPADTMVVHDPGATHDRSVIPRQRRRLHHGANA
jgi:inner membrane transporter RhtA